MMIFYLYGFSEREYGFYEVFIGLFVQFIKLLLQHIHIRVLAVFFGIFNAGPFLHG